MSARAHSHAMPGALGVARRVGACDGITLIEVAVATVIIALLASALQGAGETIFGGLREADDAWQATELGLALLEEVAGLPFDDPQLGETTRGPEAGEWAPGGKRTLLDDVDDYTVWTSGMTLQTKEGEPIPIAGFQRSVAVVYVDADDFGSVSPTATDYKRITVAVYRNGVLRDTFTTVRVQGGRDVDFDG